MVAAGVPLFPMVTILQIVNQTMASAVTSIHVSVVAA
jgi:hypothetical protein